MENNKSKFNIREAQKEDVNLILELIKELAAYEKLTDKVTASEDVLYDSIFVKKKAEVIIAEYEDKPIGYGLYFYNFSTFLGKHGVYLEDIYIKPEYRGMGFGKNILSFIAKRGKEQGCERFEWACLNWNEPSIKFYKQMGAHPMDEWVIYRLENKALNDLAEEFS